MCRTAEVAELLTWSKGPMIGVKAIRFPDGSQVGAASSAQGSTQPRSRIRCFGHWR